MARHILKRAEGQLDGAAALLQRAVERLRVASAYAGDGASKTAFDRFYAARELIASAIIILDKIEREHTTEDGQ